ncbi:hypothetical protein [Chlamydia suis]|uniref:hypothetical protein n=1 Tax=Chlamydia suis TaxID=83559 RepID=UPI002F91492A
MYIFSSSFFFMQHAHGSDTFPAWDCLQRNYLRRGLITSCCSYVPVLSTAVGLRTLYNMRKLKKELTERTGGFLCKNDPNTPCTWFPCSIIRKEWPKAQATAVQEVLGIKALVCLGALLLKIFRAIKAFFYKTFCTHSPVTPSTCTPANTLGCPSPAQTPVYETPSGY